MMRRLLFTLLLLVFATAAFAQVAEISVNLGEARARNNGIGSLVQGGSTNDVKIDTGFRFGFRFTMNSWRFFGHEFGYAYTRSKIAGPALAGSVSMPIHQGMYDFLAYATPEGSVFRPFASGGVHFTSYYPPGTSVYYGNGATKFGVNYGGGVKVKVSQMFLIRFDVHDYMNGKPDIVFNPKGWIHMLEVSGGLAFAF